MVKSKDSDRPLFSYLLLNIKLVTDYKKIFDRYFVVSILLIRFNIIYDKNHIPLKTRKITLKKIIK